MVVAEISIDPALLGALIGAIFTLAASIFAAIYSATYGERKRQQQQLLFRKKELLEALYGEMGRIIIAISAAKDTLSESTISSLSESLPVTEEELLKSGTLQLKAVAPIDISYTIVSTIEFSVYDFAVKDPLLYYKLGDEALSISHFYVLVKSGIQGYVSAFQTMTEADSTQAFWAAQLDQPDSTIKKRKSRIEAFFKYQNDYMLQNMAIFVEEPLKSALSGFDAEGKKELENHVSEDAHEYLGQLLSKGTACTDTRGVCHTEFSTTPEA